LKFRRIYVYENLGQAYSRHRKAVLLHAKEVLVGEEVKLLLILDLGTRWG
jgi:hypothetical protein